MKEIIQFSHANGFPASIYRKMFDALGNDFDIHAIDRFGHDERYPVTPGWPHLVTQLTDALQVHSQPAWLVGHSLGGLLSLMASLKAPGQVRGVILLDSPVVAGWRAAALRLVQRLNVDEKYSPAAVTKNRRERWSSLEEVLEHFGSKPAFARWDADVLRAYVEHGTEPAPDGGRTLAFRRETEYWIYRTLPNDLGKRLRRGVPAPVACIMGTHSREMRQAGTGATRRLVGKRMRIIDGGHLYPMEKPLDTARLIRELIDTMR